MEVRTVPFMDEDPLEQDMGVRCEGMTPEQLVAYVKTYQAAFGLHLPVIGLPERSVFKGMQRIYGAAEAGLIVKWVFWRHRGRWDGEPVRHLSFSKGRKWWVDKMYLEMQEERRRSEPRAYEAATLGGRGLLDL
jgi:hypothetical protein